MSSQNSQVIRGMYDALTRGDVDAILNSLTEDVVWDVPGAAPYAGVREGREQVRAYFAERDRVEQSDQYDLEETVSEGDKVVALGRQRATVKESGSRFEERWAHVYTLRNGRVASALFCGDTHAAASAYGESNREREALGGPLGITHPAYSGRPGGDEF